MIYDSCPTLENEKYRIRLAEINDAEALLKVYSDKNALPFFNSDNCSDFFYYTTVEVMRDVIKYWLWEYDRKGFVRMSIIDKRTGMAIGTIELFNRRSEDFFNNCGLLRLDVRSDYEAEEELSCILSLIVKPAFDNFDCAMLATKSPLYAVERNKALEGVGFTRTKEKLIGHDKTVYGDYMLLMK